MYDIAEYIEELGGEDNFINLVKNLQITLEENANLKDEVDFLRKENSYLAEKIMEFNEKIELYKSLNRAMKLGEYENN
ncbi:MAG: hypothetical protein R3321_08095 [Nitrososphaeraceae archaeon]|nr:hypothetical protein [Nitrososphaeraceae archaeon]